MLIWSVIVQRTSHVNPFTANWTDEENWLRPPASNLASETLQRKRKRSVVGTSLAVSIVFAKFIKDFTLTELFYRTEVSGSAFSEYAKFETLI